MTEKRDDLMKTDSNKFSTIMDEVERLHEQGILIAFCLFIFHFSGSSL